MSKGNKWRESNREFTEAFYRSRHAGVIEPEMPTPSMDWRFRRFKETQCAPHQAVRHTHHERMK